MNTSDTLTLQVLNSQYLASGQSASALLDMAGGLIGCDENNEWSLQDQHGQIENCHAQIVLIDGHYCLKALAANLQLNHIDLFQNNKPIRLQQGDQVQLGALTLRVHINKSGQLTDDPLAMRPEEMIANHADPLNDILSREPTNTAHTDAVQTRHSTAEVVAPMPLDPIKVLDAEKITTTTRPADQQAKLFQQSNHNLLAQSINLNPQTGQCLNEEDRLINVAIYPLYQGLSSTLPLNNSQEAYELLEEIGDSLKQVIEGLKDLHSNNPHLADKQLRPTEDNPLRLNQSYQETINLLYSTDKCPVHLSAPSAIAESLAYIKLHHQANQQAISEALSALLAAFSPQALITRFARYRRHSDKTAMDSAWAWDIYSRYYDELRSKRQKGFDKLFWEVYAHAYDRQMRELQNQQDQQGSLSCD
ncbi:type VI secretion system-associated FHA domain protein TagH [Utexia brackfieldae]|uniref:type VI secretion system-associated FHA domain protein TagH n=1 Tax=Utexia brackfieldae TaxID=3074108 RepID=UPI00370D683F